jgi:acyl-CoA synthetase (AMP-forming)/AMP-acid ligase II
LRVIDVTALAGVHGDSVAIRGANSITYGELAERVHQRAREFRDAGVEERERVVLVCLPGTEAIISALALIDLECMTIPVGAETSAWELTAILERCGSPWVVRGGDASRALPGTASKPSGPPAALGLLSSGSTGTPKLVLRSAEHVVAGFGVFVDSVRVTAEDRTLGLLPLEHSYGYNNVMLATLSRGGTIVLPGTTHPRAVLDTIVREQVTVFPGAPVFFDLMVRFGAGHAGKLPLRVCLSVGTALSKRIHDSFTAAFGVPLWQSYGTSESGPATLNRAGISDGEMLALGEPCPGVGVEICGGDGNPLPDGVQGEIVIRSPAVGIGYDGAHDGSSRFDGRTFFTGDLGVRRGGILCFAGRRKLLIAAAGHKVDPVEVENAILQHPDVSDVAVLGHLDSDGAELVKAVICARRQIQFEEMADFCSERLSSYKVPRIVEFRDSLPRNAMGKLQRDRL